MIYSFKRKSDVTSEMKAKSASKTKRVKWDPKSGIRMQWSGKDASIKKMYIKYVHT